MTEDGASGFAVGHSPYAPALRNDPYYSGTNMSCCLAAFNNAALGTYGPGTFKLDRDVELADKDSKRSQGTYIVYAPEHRDLNELPLQTMPVVVNQGLAEPTLGVAGQSAFLQSIPIHPNSKGL